MIDGAHPLLLGSASPRRKAILETLGLPVRVAVVEVDETVLPRESPAAYLERVVAAKLGALRATAGVADAGALLVADTSVIVDGEILGKPRDAAEGREMIGRLSGRAHEVHTRFAVSDGGAQGSGAAAHAETVVTRVVFRTLDEGEVARYVATGEGSDKAGGYAIQGVGSFAVSRIEGSYPNVVGLPACEVIAALLRTGLLARFPDRWSSGSAPRTPSDA